MNVVYVLWTGDSPDKGVATTDLVEFGKARESLRNAGVSFKYALLPVTPASEVMSVVNLIIKENTNACS